MRRCFMIANNITRLVVGYQIYIEVGYIDSYTPVLLLYFMDSISETSVN